MAKKTFNLFLGKENVQEFSELLSDSAREKIGTPAARVYENIDFAEQATLHIFSNRPSKPPWARRLESTFDLQINTRSQSACGVLLFVQDGRFFASTFSFGWMYLEERALVRDFGLRTAINALDNEKLKRLERTNLSDALRDSALSPFQRDFNSFGVDDALELIRSLSGKTIDGIDASSIAGSSSLKWTSERELEELDQTASDALELFLSNTYQNTPFAIMDILRPVVDLDLIDELNHEIADHLRRRSGNFELGMPIPVGDEDVSYWFQGLSGRRSYEDLVIDNYLNLIEENLENLSIQMLKDQRIVARVHSVDNQSISTSLHTALVGSVSYNNILYAINEGLWYQVEQQFKDSVDELFRQVVQDWQYEPKPFIRRASPNGQKMFYEREEHYNTRIANELGFHCLDGKLVSNPNFVRSQIEVCDLLDLEGKRLIHVKKNSRKSSVLSHLFKQGSNSAQNLKHFGSFKREIRSMLAREFDNDVAVQFENADANDQNWSIEYWIADSVRADGGFNIPFFSKITFRDEVRKLRGMEYDVAIRFIELQTPAAG